MGPEGRTGNGFSGVEAREQKCGSCGLRPGGESETLLPPGPRAQPGQDTGKRRSVRCSHGSLPDYFCPKCCVEE